MHKLTSYSSQMAFFEAITKSIQFIAQRIQEVQNYFQNISMRFSHYQSIMQISSCQSSRDTVQTPIDELIRLSGDSHQCIHSMLKGISEYFEDLKKQLFLNQGLFANPTEKSQIFEIPIQLNHLELEESEKLQIIEGYLSNNTFQHLPESLKNILLKLQNFPSVQFYEVPIEVDIEASSTFHEKISGNSLEINTAKFFDEENQSVKELEGSLSSICFTKRKHTQHQSNRNYLSLNDKRIFMSQFASKQNSKEENLNYYFNVYSIAVEPLTKAYQKIGQVCEQELTFSKCSNYVLIPPDSIPDKDPRKNEESRPEVKADVKSQQNQDKGSFSNNSDNQLAKLSISKRVSFESFSDNQLSYSPLKASERLMVPQSNINWSASIQSFVIGANNQKNPLKIKEEQSGQQHCDNLQLKLPAPFDSVEVKEVKKPSLANHPELNFCGSSQINENNNNEKTYSFLASVNAQDHELSLKFKESWIAPEANRQQKCIDPTGSVYGSLAELAISQNIKKKKEKDMKKVYIIEAHSSSQGSHTDREMYVSNLRTKNIRQKSLSNHSEKNKKGLTGNWCHNMNKSINSLGSKINQNQKNMTQQYYQLKEHNATLQQQKSLYIEQLHKSESEVQGLRMKVQQKDEGIKRLEQQYKAKLQQIISKIYIYEEKLHTLESQLQNKTMSENLITEKVQEHEHTIEVLNKEIKDQHNKIADLQDLKDRLEQQRIQEQARFISLIQQKQKLISDISQQYESFKSISRDENYALAQRNSDLQCQTEKLKEDIDAKTQKMDNLQQQYNDLVAEVMNSELSHENLNSERISHLYSEELNRIYEKYEQIIQAKTVTINQLQKQNIRMLEELDQEKYKMKFIEKQLSLDKRAIEHTGKVVGERQNCHQLIKSLLPGKVIEEIEYLRKQLIDSEKKCAAQQVEIEKLKVKGAISIEFLVQKQDPGEYQIKCYIGDLEQILGKYEQIIVNSHFAIKQLHDRVYEYLKDALQKEQTQEKMYEQYLQSENQLNTLLLDKITLEIQNKRMKKMLMASQKKISLIGSRLVNAGRIKLPQCSNQTSKETTKPLRINPLSYGIPKAIMKNPFPQHHYNQLMDTITK